VIKINPKRWKLQHRITLFALVIILIIVVQSSILFYFTLSETIETQLGKRATHVAKTVATTPEIVEAFQTDKPWLIIQPIVERIRLETDAEFIVVGNIQGVRYSHPIPARIGKEMVGGDNERALVFGETYTSKAVGSLGPSLRGKTPIRDTSGKIIGIVSVGFLLDDIDLLVHSYGMPILWIALSAIFIGIMGSLLLSRNIKRILFNLEPEEISALYKERNAVLQSVREGIIVANKEGRIALVNQAAYEILSLQPEEQVIGRHILEVVANSSMLAVLQSGEEQLDRQMELRGKTIIVNRLPVKDGDEVIGVVSSFRLKSEIDQLTEELSQVKRYTEALRAQTHEYNNFLYALSGLLQLESYSEALELIHKETESHQDFVQLIMRKFKDPWLGGILLGFYNRAKELKIQFQVDRESSLKAIPAYLDQSHLVSILGNLITNALESVEKNEEDDKIVRFFVTDLGDDVVFEIEDSGPGIHDENISCIFRKGYTTKSGEKRGYGLAKVEELVQEMDGSLAVEKGQWGGALFIVVLPKQRGGSR
jgi:two-component system CitB family sensor kinase